MKHCSRLQVTIGLVVSIILGMLLTTDIALCTPAPGISVLPAITAEISTPVRFATDSAGNIYVTDPNSGGILKYNNAVSTVQHIPTSKNGSGVAIAQNGDILVTQGAYVAVLEKANNYQEKLQFGTFGYANGITVDPVSGNIYVTDGRSNNIRKFDVSYNLLLTSSAIALPLTRPAGIQYEKASNLLVVANSLSGKILFVKPADLTLELTVGTNGAVGTFGYDPAQASGNAPKFTYPQGVAFEYDGGGALYRIYVSDAYQNTVKVLDGATKTWLADIGGYGFSAGKLYTPSDVLFDQSSSTNKRIFVANGGGNVTVFGCDNMQPTNIRVINPDLNSLTVAWANPSNIPGFNKVRIYRANAAGLPIGLLTDTLTGTDTSFVDNGLTVGTAYYYLVRAVDSIGTEFNNTQPVTGTTRKNYTLTLSTVGLTTGTAVGSGTINGTDGASCGDKLTNSVSILDTTVVTMTAYPSTLTSVFAGWTGDCAVFGINETCQVTMSAAKNVTASFKPQSPFLVDGWLLDTLQDAHNTADGSGSIIEAMAGIWPSSTIGNPNTMTANRPISVTIKGGYDSDFISQSSGTTVITGRINLRSGKTIFNNIKIRP